MDGELLRKSKFLSLVLRHKPETIGIKLGSEGWCLVEDLLEACKRKRSQFSREDLVRIVRSNDKQRFAFNEDESKIRANQGHSIDVDLNYASSTPPDRLFHGTVARFIDSIKKKGLIKGQRHHVHLSPDKQTAVNVGKRRGEPVVLTIDAGQMYKDGFRFYCSKNGVWLTETVPPQYIQFIE